MSDALRIAFDVAMRAIGLALKLADEAPNKDEARAELAARLQRQFQRGRDLDDVHAEDLAILDERLKP